MNQGNGARCDFASTKIMDGKLFELTIYHNGSRYPWIVLDHANEKNYQVPATIFPSPMSQPFAGRFIVNRIDNKTFQLTEVGSGQPLTFMYKLDQNNYVHTVYCMNQFQPSATHQMHLPLTEVQAVEKSKGSAGVQIVALVLGGFVVLGGTILLTPGAPIEAVVIPAYLFLAYRAIAGNSNELSERDAQQMKHLSPVSWWKRLTVYTKQ